MNKNDRLAILDAEASDPFARKYVLTERDPVCLTDTGIEPGVDHVIKRACNHDKN